MDNVIAISVQLRAQPQAGNEIERVSDPQRCANHTSLASSSPQLARRITQQLGFVASTQQLESEAHHLGLAATEVLFRIYTRDAHGP